MMKPDSAQLQKYIVSIKTASCDRQLSSKDNKEKIKEIVVLLLGWTKSQFSFFKQK